MLKIKAININCDLGEGIGNDALLMPFLGSCNIACGGHFGNQSTMREALLLAQQHHVKVGAHPSFPDPENFGRKKMEMTPEDLVFSIRQQVMDFRLMCDEIGLDMHHVKLHGALYNLASKDLNILKTVLKALEPFGRTKLYFAANASIMDKVQTNVQFCPEAFIDRSYEDDGSLVARENALALIESPQDACKQLNMILNKNAVITINNQQIPLKAETFCVHGDNPQALEILQFIQQKLAKNE